MLNKTVMTWGAVVVATALLAGCGGGGGDGASAPPKPDIGTSVGALVGFMQSLIAGTSETSEPIDTDSLVLVVDDSAEPAPL